jgi:hypothetical protein
MSDQPTSRTYRNPEGRPILVHDDDAHDAWKDGEIDHLGRGPWRSARQDDQRDPWGDRW